MRAFSTAPRIFTLSNFKKSHPAARGGLVQTLVLLSKICAEGREEDHECCKIRPLRASSFFHQACVVSINTMGSSEQLSMSQKDNTVGNTFIEREF
jgi:hypothetical protein